MSKYLFLLASLFLGLARADWGQPDPDHDPNFKKRRILPVSSCSIRLADGKSMDLAGYNYNLNDIEAVKDVLRILEATKTGKPLAAKLKKDISSGRVTIGMLTSWEKESKGMDEGVMALYRFDPEKNTREMLVDILQDRGLVAIFLAHEITHSMDSNLEANIITQFKASDRFKVVYDQAFNAAANRLKKDITRVRFDELLPEEQAMIDTANADYKKISDPIVYAAERFAFNGQDAFIKEVKNKWSCYRSFLKEHAETNELKVEPPTSDDFIVSRYHLNKENLK